MYEQVEVFTNPRGRGRRSHKHDDMVDALVQLLLHSYNPVNMLREMNEALGEW